MPFLTPKLSLLSIIYHTKAALFLLNIWIYTRSLNNLSERNYVEVLLDRRRQMRSDDGPSVSRALRSRPPQGVPGTGLPAG